ncbi:MULTISPECIES: hypothetical protein [unclassified Treponema]|uniref:hypothetical protein n=1 Tax=unclassified Treponema TaxID=2638727 RepID=UPI0020A29E0F|nr:MULTISPECIES: hypothetical protein [unclassified Treponema]UTC66976.1 hypothetical protein E4O06_13705 [Treponema sp. OMZ 789]UTC69705.1 hypothetical protein E4O01_13845 [Treponema sp. OMZ 790]UTC72419.1 hypothetical protein E4O02_13935 [Treponema sp. OMZ 791]
MDKKAKNILMYYMDDVKRNRLSSEEIAYAKKHGAILDDLYISAEETVQLLTQILNSISLTDAANSFLYSLSARDMEYRYVLASYVYASSWLNFDRGKADKVPPRLNRTFYNWVKYRGGGIWGEIGKPIFYLDEFTRMNRKKAANFDENILRKILILASAMNDTDTGVTLCKKIMEDKLFPCNKNEVIGILETLAICGILETPEHKGYLSSFTPPLMRDTGDLRQSLSYPLNWWRGANKVNYKNCNRIFNIDLTIT